MKEMKVGYKNTEIGLIPDGWIVCPMGDISVIQRGASPRPINSPIWFDDRSNVGWLRISDVSKSKKYLIDTIQNLSQDGINNSRFVSKNNLVMSICATVGRPIITYKDLCIHDGFVVFNHLKADKEYMYYVLSSIENDWYKYGQTGSQMNLNTGLINNTTILLPKDTKEQQAIASALSDIDELIANLEKLVQKKIDIKTATMQQLLTGKKRLSGFNQKWSERYMTQDSYLKARIGWQGLTTAEYKETGKYILITGTDFKNGRIDWDSCCYVEQERYEQDKNIQIQEGDILLTKDGTIGKVAYVDKLPELATLNSGVFVIRPINNSYYPLYFYYVLRSKIFGDFLNKLQAGSTINHLYQKDFIHFSFIAPQIEEQKAIAKILFDMDREIESLEKQLEKAKLIKIGMMQELLTGKTRLINKE